MPSGGTWLLHGLAGNAEEWAATARGLVATTGVLALDQRGHGRSERNPGEDVSQAAFVGDVEFWLEHLDWLRRRSSASHSAA